MADQRAPVRLDDVPLVLYAADIAALLRCSQRTLDRLHRAQQLPEPLPIPGRPRWAREAVLTWLAAGAPRRGRR